jgi:hypothetical protein
LATEEEAFFISVKQWDVHDYIYTLYKRVLVLMCLIGWKGGGAILYKEDMEKYVKLFYEKPDGNFALVEIGQSDKEAFDKLRRLLYKLGIYRPIDREKILSTWKNYYSDDVRRFRG